MLVLSCTLMLENAVLMPVASLLMPVVAPNAISAISSVLD
jgi:hypothetical protein